MTDIELEGIKKKVLHEDIQEGQANIERQEQNLPTRSEENNEVGNIEEEPADNSSYWEQTREYPEFDDDDENAILNRELEII